MTNTVTLRIRRRAIGGRRLLRAINSLLGA